MDKNIPSAKIILVGNSLVGKTSILTKHTDDKFNLLGEKPTVGLDFRLYYHKINQKTIALELWDTAGSERYKTITPAFYRGSSAIIFVFDVTNEASFISIDKWIEETIQNVDSKPVKMLVGNKIDSNEREVSYEKAEQFAKQRGMWYIETSAKTGENMNIMFDEMAKQLLNSIQNECIVKPNKITLDARCKPKKKVKGDNCSC